LSAFTPKLLPSNRQLVKFTFVTGSAAVQLILTQAVEVPIPV